MNSNMPEHSEWRGTARFCFAAFCMDFASGMYYVAIPYIGLALGASSLELGVLGALRGGVYALVCLPAAMLSDRHSRRALIAISGIGLLLTYGAAVGAHTLRMLFISPVLLGLSLSLYWPTLFAWFGDARGGDDRLGPASGALNLSWSAGVMLGGFAAGWLFKCHSRLPLIAAMLPITLAATAMVLSPCSHSRPAAAAPSRSRPGTKRDLAAAWLGNISVCVMLGLMSGVFPKLGDRIGVDPAGFGVLMGGLGLGRTLVFLSGLRWSRRLHGNLLGTASQILAACMVAGVAITSDRRWLFGVFFSVGLAIGVNFFRGLYRSLEHAGSRGLKSGIHEASLLLGVFFGSLGGGALAQAWGLRAPYVPIAALTVLLVCVQLGLVASATGARRATDTDVSASAPV